MADRIQSVDFFCNFLEFIRIKKVDILKVERLSHST
jgi:hypothetical protein